MIYLLRRDAEKGIELPDWVQTCPVTEEIPQRSKAGGLCKEIEKDTGKRMISAAISGTPGVRRRHT